MNLTYPTTLVLHALANGSGHGFDVIDATGLASGTVYPILRRLEEERLVSARWEKRIDCAGGTATATPILRAHGCRRGDSRKGPQAISPDSGESVTAAAAGE